jgi:hypothetical protein
MFWARVNHVLLLARNFGLGSAELRRWMPAELRAATTGIQSTLGRRLVRFAMAVGAIAVGLVLSLPSARWRAADPRRRDETGEAIRRRLGGLRSMPQT